MPLSRAFTLFFLPLLLGPRTAGADTASDIRALTGAPMRMVWIQDAGPTASVYSEHPTVRLMGFDTEDGKGERPVLPAIGWYGKPILTADGQRVVFANLANHSVEVVNFDGTGRRELFKNDDSYKFDPKSWIDNAVWTDPQTGVTWVYAMIMEQRDGKPVPSIRRYQLDHPGTSELVWDKTPAYMFMVSGDGRVASGGTLDGGNSPQGMFFLPNNTFIVHHNGCWPSMSPDASHRMWVFEGNHKAILFFTPMNSSGSMSVNPIEFAAPGLTLDPACETYHPRWSNNVHFLSIDAEYPYKQWKWTSDIKISNDIAEKVQIYLGKFNDGFTGVEKWVQVTHSKGGNYWSNVWIKPSQADLDALAAATKAPATALTVAPSPKGLVYTWLNGGAGNQITDAATGNIRQCNGQLKGDARYALGYVMDLTGGSFVPDNAADPLLAACKASNQFALEADLTPTGPVTNDTKVIIGFGGDPATGNFVLAQQGDQLVFGLKTDGADTLAQPVPLFPLTPNQPNHVVISYADGKLAAFLNGVSAPIANSPHGGLSNWTAQSLIFGDSATGGHNWAGTLQDINLFSRAMDLAEVRDRFVQERTRTGQVKPVDRIVVEAKLSGRCAPADPNGIAPYRRCLNIQVYDLQKVISAPSADTKVDPKIAVAQWSVLDAKQVPAYLQQQVGQTYTLALEKMDDHPEQESERTFNGTDDTSAMQLYYEVRNDGASPLTFSPAPGMTTLVNPTADDLTNKANLQLAGQGSVAAATLVSPGINYTQPPQAQFTGGGGQGVAGVSTLGVSSFDVSNLGGGYTSAPVVVLSPPDVFGGRQALATAQIDKASGSIAGLTLVDSGSGYLEPPQVSFSGGGGSGASAGALMAFGGVILTNGGSGYSSTPAVTLTGGGGQDAAAQPVFQVKTYSFTDPSGPCLFTNAGTIEQDGTALVLNWAAPVAPAGKEPRGLINTGTWTLKDGASVRFASTTGFPKWMDNGTTNNGTMNILGHSQLGFAVLGNGGSLQLSPGARLGQSEFATSINSLYNSGKGEIDVVGGSPDQPVVYGFAAPVDTGMREIHNGGKIIVGSGQDGSTFELLGGSINIDNSASGDFEIKPGATLALITCDNGSTVSNTSRAVRITNSGDFVLGGTLRVQPNHPGFSGIENRGKVIVQGGLAIVERLQNSAGPADGYEAARFSTEILNDTNSVLQGVGTLTYTNSTGNNEARLMRVYNSGTIAPGEPASGQSPETYGALVLRNTSVRMGGFSQPYPPHGAPANAPFPPPIPSSPPKAGTLQIGMAGPPTATNQVDTLNLTGSDGSGVLELIKGDGNILNIVTPAGFTPHGTYRIVTAVSVQGTFEVLQYNGATQIPYTVNYLPDGIEVTFP